MFQFPLTVDQVVQYHPEITTAGALRAIATTGLQRPVVWETMISGDPDADEKWKLRTRAGGENDDGLSFIVPADWNALSNNLIWVRIS